MAVRGKHFRFQVFKNKAAGDTSQVPANLVTVDVYRQGAYVEVGLAGLADNASANITLRDIPRSLIVGDDLFQLDQSPVDPTRRININTITEASRVVNIRNDTGASIDIVAGERWTPIGTKPTLFNENTLTNAVTPLQTGADGSADCYIAESSVDYVLSGGGVTAKGVPDHNGEFDNIWELIVRDVASVIAGTIKTLTTLTQGTILSIVNGTEKWKLDWDGSVTQQQKLTVAAGGITVTAGGIAVTGNSSIAGTLIGLTGVTVDSGGITVTAGGLTVVAGGVSLPNDAIDTAEIADLAVSTAKFADFATFAFTEGSAGTQTDTGGDTNFIAVASADIASYTRAGANSLFAFFMTGRVLNQDGTNDDVCEIQVWNVTDGIQAGNLYIVGLDPVVGNSFVNEDSFTHWVFLAAPPSGAKTYQLRFRQQISTATMRMLAGAKLYLIELKK